MYPSITAYTPIYVAEVNKNTQADGLHQLSHDYLSYLWSPQAQELAAQNYFRPTDKKIIAKTTALFPEVNQFDVTNVLVRGIRLIPNILSITAYLIVYISVHNVLIK